MEQPSCLRTIRGKYGTLTAAERKVADYILQNAEQILNLSIGCLADQTQTAKSAIVRCCKSLGFEGYTQLKLALAAELSRNRQLNYAPYIYPEDSTGIIIDKVFSANVKALHDTASHLDLDCLEQVLTLLQNARNIYLYGIGTSASMVTELQYRLMLLGYSAFAFTDPPTMKISTMNISEMDVAFGISYSGRTIATTEALDLARQAGAKTICITSYPDSPITRVCDYPIGVWSDEVQYPVEAMSAKIAQLSLIYALTTALSARHYDDTLQRAVRTRQLVNTIRLEEKK